MLWRILAVPTILLSILPVASGASFHDFQAMSAKGSASSQPKLRAAEKALENATKDLAQHRRAELKHARLNGVFLSHLILEWNLIRKLLKFESDLPLTDSQLEYLRAIQVNYARAYTTSTNSLRKLIENPNSAETLERFNQGFTEASGEALPEAVAGLPNYARHLFSDQVTPVKCERLQKQK